MPVGQTVEHVPGNASVACCLPVPAFVILVVSARQAKQRPLTDPLIVHVPDTASALAVVDFEVEGGGGQKARRLLDLLGEKLWPGELVHVGFERAWDEGAAMPKWVSWSSTLRRDYGTPLVNPTPMHLNF